jgi:hypothetical protein
VQVKGYQTSDFKVQTQYDVTLYEWDVYVNGRADLMAWDVYLNLGVRADQSAYHEFFLPLQVEFGRPFTIDEFNFLASFDIGNINPFAHQLGLSLQDITITAPFWVPPEEEIEEEIEEEPSQEIPIEDTASSNIEENSPADSSQSSSVSAPVKSGCAYTTTPRGFSFLTLFFAWVFMFFREEI